MEEYHTKLLSQGALEGRPFKHSNRIRFCPSNVQEDSEAVPLSERVLTRLLKIVEGKTFCAYCGKEVVKSLCTVCRKRGTVTRSVRQRAGSIIRLGAKSMLG